MTDRLDPVTLSVLASALAGIAEEMGAVLVRGAYSSNIKERRDCSAALFDGDGRLVAQAEHIPVHLGAMPESVAAVMEREPRPGDVYVLNDPYSGGTHLPDITLVSPVTLAGEIRAFAVTRAHHSDVGGMRPGSMPSDSREIWQEGVVIPPVRLVRGGEDVEDVLALLLANVRTPDIRRGDLRAQRAAHGLAEERVTQLVERWGLDTVLAAFAEVLEYAERRTRDALRDVPDGTYAARGEVEGDGVRDADLPIVVTVTVDGEEMTVDFEGTAPQTAGNVNCPLAVTRSACYFALRVLLPNDVPANAGAYAPLSIRAPEGSLVNARSPAAVVAGNVETSQRIADTVLLALAQAVELPAQGQGTMNNLVLGGPGWTYYETIGGGQGASARGDGPSGVHVGMTNTLNTPVEALELEYPLRIERYELVDGSGGEGEHRGGDGIVRSVRVLEPASLSLLTDRRRHAPQGRDGGGEGRPGANTLNDEELPPKASRELAEGDVVTVRTPGGGGAGGGLDSGPGAAVRSACRSGKGGAVSSTTSDSELKARHRAMWASGDYASMVETFLLPLGPRLVEACGIGPGMRVLDVAAGTGNASIPAAQRGASVTASDLTPELLEAGRRRAESEGVELEWVEGDAEHLPFGDESFDVVMSSIGAMFAPHHRDVADELVRVCRPGGTIGLLSWTPEGMIGALFRTMGPFAPPPPPGAQPPPLWGSEEHVRELFGDRVELGTLKREMLEITAFERPHDYGEHFKGKYGPTIAAQANARRTGREAEFDAALNGFCDDWDRGMSDRARFEQEYLLAVGTRA